MNKIHSKCLPLRRRLIKHSMEGRGFAKSCLVLVLLASVFGMVFSAAATSSINLQFVRASTDEGGGGSEGGGSDSSSDDGGNGGDSSGGDSGDDGDQQPDPDPDPQPDPEPDPQPDPQPDPIEPIVPEPTFITCPDGSQVEEGGGESCPEQKTLPVDPIEPLPLCDGSAQRCITDEGYICEIGSGDHGCECEEDFSDCPLHPSKPPLESPSPDRKPLPYCDIVNRDPNWEGACHDRKDFDDITGLYPCNDGTQEEDWRDCEDVSDYEYPCDPTTDPNCEDGKCPPPITGIQDPCGEPVCKKGYELINGKCVEEDEDRDRIKIIVKNTQVTKVIHKHDSFPEIDIIGLSIKDNGDAMVCMMKIEGSDVQCQEFAVPNDRINENIWRVIETDHSKDYDNGNTGSGYINGAIEEIKDYQFNDLEDRNNHDFGVDLAAVGINPVGDGLVCLIDDPAGTSLCEPFKVSNQAISGQITEITEIDK